MSYSVVKLRKKKQTTATCLLDRQFRVENNVLTKSFPESGAKRPCVCEPAVPSLQKYQISNFHEQFVDRGSFHPAIGSIWKGASE